MSAAAPPPPPPVEGPAHPDAGAPTPRWRRWLPRVLLGLAALALALWWGVTTATAELSLGPHEARYDVTTDATVTIDLGPFGTLLIDSPLPLALGVRVTVEEIPSDVDALHGIDTLQALTGDLTSYLQFFTGPQATIEDAARALAVNAAWRTLGGLAVLVAAWFAGRALLGAARRRELAARLAPRTRQIVAGSVAVVLVGTVVTASEANRARARTGSQTATAVFDGSPLEGARITGRLGGIVDTYGGLVVQAYRENEEFYRDADDALVAAWADWEARDAAASSAGSAAGQAAGQMTGHAAGQVTGSPTTGAPASASPEPTAPPEPTGPPEPADRGTAVASAPTATTTPAEQPEPLTLLVVSDLHCNVGMARLITSLTEISGAQVVLDAGDTTMNGTSVEQYCVTTFARAIPAGVDLVTAPGNHDSAETTAQYAAAGATVLDGGVIDVHGMRILGDQDPKASRLIVTQTQDESYSQVGDRLSDVACDDPDGVDLVLFHNPRIAPRLLAGGCVPAQVSGHMHTRTDPGQVEQGIRYISSSTAGAQENEPRIGPLKGIAEMTLLRWDPTTRSILDWQLVEIGTDGSATVHDREAWPLIRPVADPDGTGGVEESGGVEGADGAGAGASPSAAPGPSHVSAP